MDLMTILGLILGIGSVYYVMNAGGITALLLNVNAAILVFGGTLASTLISYPFKVLKQAVKVLRFVVFPSKRYAPTEIIETIIRLSERSRRTGISSLTDEIHVIKDRFLVDAIQMLVDNIDPEIIRDNLEKDILFTRKRHTQVAGVFRTMGTYSPIFGLLGTLIGVVQVLRNLSDPQAMGTSMAIAVTTTFYGIFGTNFIFLPIAAKLTVHSEDELLIKEVVIEGILSIQNGEIPIIVRKKLQAFLSYKLRQVKAR